MNDSDPRSYYLRYLASRTSPIIWWPIVEVIEASEPLFADALKSTGSIRFPDGSVCVESVDGIVTALQIIEKHRQSGLEMRENTMFRSLGCFPKREYQLITTWEYFDRIGGEEDFHVAPIAWCDIVYPNELTPEHISVYMKFWRRPSSDTVTGLRHSLLEWHESVGEKGIFAQQPARLVADSFASSGKTCSFTIDVAGSSQQTVNWLILTSLNFGSRVWPISEISFAHES